MIFSTLSLLAFTVSPLAWCLLLAGPVLLLLGYYIQHNLIHKKIIRQPITTELCAENKSYAFPFLTPEAVSYELDSLCSNPQKLNQGAFNLCGIAAILYALAYSRPDDLKKFVYAFVQDPASVGLSLPTRCYSKDAKLSVMTLIMMAAKHSSNLTGYHPIYETLEQIQGASPPKELVNWIGFVNHYLNIPKESNWVNESLVLRNRNLQPLSWAHRTLLGGVYSNIHNTFDTPTKHFEALMNAYNEHSSIIILLISVNLCLKILGEANPDVHQTLLGVEFSHYVYLNQLSQWNNSLTVKISTWGVCAERNITREDFIQGFCGFLVWGALARPNHQATLSSTHELEAARKNYCQSLSLHNIFNQRNTNRIENKTRVSNLVSISTL